MTETPLKLALFDVDGTLVDSQETIVSCMQGAFDTFEYPVPTPQDILSIVGLSLPVAVERLAPDLDMRSRALVVDAYKEMFRLTRHEKGAGHSPLYAGARKCLDALHDVPELLLGVATGKSKRGLDGLLQAHDLKMFVTQQVADHHPSKPHPSMVFTAMEDVGVAPEHCVMIGDTTYDIEMGRAAGVKTVGVDWGYHPAYKLGADHLVTDFNELQDLLLNRLWKN